MGYSPDRHHRKSIRLKEYDYKKEGKYYITICTINRECLLGDISDGKMILNEYGNIVLKSWKWLSEQYSYITLDETVIMPNHLHGIIIITNLCRGGSRTAPTGEDIKYKPLGRLIGAFKTVSTKNINQIRNMPEIPFWQRNYYERIIRDEKDLNKIREYIKNNPLKWELDEENLNRKK